MASLDGIYLITFRGAADWGIGMLVLQNGIITGADVAGILYDGSYNEHGTSVNVELKMSVPAGVALVQGAPARPTPYSVETTSIVPRSAFDSQETILLKLPPGPVNVIFQRLRTFDD